jgi:DNA-binding CsgD family transcriptional regulator
MSIDRAGPPRARSLSPPLGLRTSVLTMGGEDWLVLSFPVTVSALPDALTPAERGVVEAVLRGLSTADIARERGTSVHTVGNQLASVFKKLGVHSRLDLVRSVGAAPGTNGEAATKGCSSPASFSTRSRSR